MTRMSFVPDLLTLSLCEGGTVMDLLGSYY